MLLNNRVLHHPDSRIVWVNTSMVKWKNFAVLSNVGIPNSTSLLFLSLCTPFSRNWNLFPQNLGHDC